MKESSMRKNETNAGITVANAPISYGAFELTVGIDPNVPDGVAILDEVASAGYAGIDLGPVGFLGEGAELGRRLGDRGLGLAGAYLEFPYADEAQLDRVMPELDAMLDTFDAVAPYAPGPRPRPTIADNGSEARRNRPGSGVRNPSSGHDDATWELFGEGLRRVVDRCRARGYEPTFHHETGTFVESPAEIEKVLSLSDVGLCLDTGHFLIGGGMPLEALRKWSSRINHVHIKDASLAVFERIVEDDEPTMAIWSREAFPVLGEGDADLDTLPATLAEIGYEGWLIVEQDILPQTRERFEQAIRDQRANRAYLAERGL
jgi:inosose dehydratase